jgi:cytochrome c-type protein NapC
MITPDTIAALAFLLNLVLVALLFARPSLTASREGKILAFVALFLFPVLCSAVGFSRHMERSKTTTFCLSCHVMEPFGKSLYVDDAHYLAAAHFQNHRVPADEACYTCHTDYVLYGGIRAKWRGMRHVYVQYLGKPPAPADIRLYTPYNNRECLHCHLGARSFEGSATHTVIREDILSNHISCISGGCHDTVHNVANLANVKSWKGTP